ncbi:uncharacterized protein LOC131654913 [Vicia villosa]|uniref:uncharacterized protein LOC131654913 n=1 Tax=Vicia villosa TaxID=3911 RepID=UPI00273CD26A|nr:uncharacterized protein LOC131654913 [Vicia villosa]
MASSSSRSTGAGAGKPKPKLNFFANAMKQKHSFIQFFAMTGILFLSMRSVGQKYKIHGLQEDVHDLREEHSSVTDRMNNIKRSLLDEASRDSSGVFAARLRSLFNE